MKLFLALLFCFPTLSFASSDFEICIHSRVYNNMASVAATNPDLSPSYRFLYRHLGDTILGHASISIRNRGTTTRTYGYWPDENLLINNEDEIYKEQSGTIEHGSSPVNYDSNAFCYPIAFSQIEMVENLARSYSGETGNWTEMNNCVSFAAHVFRQTTGVQIPNAIPLPRALYLAIEQMGQAARLQSSLEDPDLSVYNSAQSTQ